MGPDLRYLLDSVILIDHFNGIDDATKFLGRHGADSAISVITRAEVLVGFSEDAEPLALDLLEHFPAFPVTIKVAEAAARLRRRASLKLPDALQAAMAAEHHLTLVTRNTRDFKPGGTPEVLIPYSI